MSVPRAGHSGTLLLDGRVLVAGGESNDVEESGKRESAEIWNPATGRWTLTAPMACARREHSAMSLSDGRVLVFSLEFGCSVAAEVWSPATGRWQRVEHADDERLELVRLEARPGGGFAIVLKSNGGELVRRFD
jgi:hypothetical protein